MAIDFTEDLWIDGFGVTRSTSDRLCNAVGPPVAPVTSCARVLLIHVSCDLSMRKKCFHAVLWNIASCEPKTVFFSLFLQYSGFFFEFDTFQLAVFSVCRFNLM